jgi:hypothetical protein
MDVAKLIFLRSKSVLFGRQVLHKSLMSSYTVRLLHGRHSIGHNVFQLGEVAEIEVQIFNFAQKLNRRTIVEFSPKSAILPN